MANHRSKTQEIALLAAKARANKIPGLNTKQRSMVVAELEAMFWAGYGNRVYEKDVKKE